MEFLTYYLIGSLVFFAFLMFLNKGKIGAIEKKNRKYLYAKLTVYSLLFGILLPALVLAPEAIAGWSGGLISFGDDDSVLESQYAQTEAFDKDMTLIGSIILVALSLIAVIVYIAS
ncbi:hypothetical protein [Vibrio parahaemolyticus]|uniref:hypothetical protein n=2 Tax=Vibrio TaxID=662 RepID=UPI001E35A5F9|nr:hypothetical protein [Vibrio parahaemolyticus]